MTWQELRRLVEDFGGKAAHTKTFRQGNFVTGLVSFGEKREADSVIDALDGKRIEGGDERLKVNYESDGDDVVKRPRKTENERPKRRVSRSRSRSDDRRRRR
jgi:hypothetical protein